MDQLEDRPLPPAGALQPHEPAQADGAPAAGLRGDLQQRLRGSHDGHHRGKHCGDGLEALPGAHGVVGGYAHHPGLRVHLHLHSGVRPEVLRPPQELLERVVELLRLHLRRGGHVRHRAPLLGSGLRVRGLADAALSHLPDSPALPPPAVEAPEDHLLGARALDTEAGQRADDPPSSAHPLQHLGRQPLLLGEALGVPELPRQLRPLRLGLHHPLPGGDGRGLELHHARPAEGREGLLRRWQLVRARQPLRCDHRGEVQGPQRQVSHRQAEQLRPDSGRLELLARSLLDDLHPDHLPHGHEPCDRRDPGGL
mmetsp:Transcript_54017/g.167442  ORF Transcript_54017/g.167442 Transcript_54017/m.167442 type:complete len:311 (-) Transcript_54017:587-1519(-)